MPKPLRSEIEQPQDVQFKHFGVLDSGHQSKGSVFTALAVNLLLALIAIVIGAAAATVVHKDKQDIAYVVPVKPPPPMKEPPKPPPPKIIPPKPLPTPPVPPKIKLPDVKPIEPPKPVAVTMPKPLPAVTPAPPKAVVAAAAPKPTIVNLGRSASVVNNDPHPAPVALGSVTNPIHPMTGPATANVNLGQKGMAGMPPGSGGGPRSASVNLGSGQPNGSLAGGGPRAIAGVKLGGVTGGTGDRPGNGVGSRPAVVALGQAPAPPQQVAVQATKAVVRSGPQVTYKPKPTYTADATAAHVEGDVSVRIHVAANGAVTVIGVTSGLGHGLDESAVRCAQGIRFKPAQDANGNPIDWEGVVKISFQLA